MKKIIVFGLAISLVGCKFFAKKENDSPKIQPNYDLPDDAEEASVSNHVVMMIDAGIDPNHTAYKDKVIASYTLVCQDDESGLDYSTPQNLKESTLRKIASSHEYVFGSHCRLENGIKTHLQAPPRRISDRRKEWNYRLRNKEYKIEEKLRDVYEHVSDSVGEYHGTNTTAMVAYKNPNVKFILVEKLLEKGGSGKLNCDAVRKDLTYMELIHDTELRNAYLQKSVLSERKLIDELAKKHHVSLINKSYGMTRETIARVLRYSNCSSGMVDPIASFLATTFEIENEIARKMHIDYDSEPFLTIQSAGNEGSRTDSIKENFFCSKAENHMMIGSYNLNRGNEQRSSFSNYGACVNLYSLGGNIISSNPFKFLTLTDGTSFSAPLTVRYISCNFSESMSPKEIRAELMKRLDSREFLPPSKHFQYAAFEDAPGQLKLAGEHFVIDDSSPALDRSLLQLHLP